MRFNMLLLALIKQICIFFQKQKIYNYIKITKKETIKMRSSYKIKKAS